VTGEDLTRVMDYIDFSGIPYPASPDFARVLLVLAKYAIFGIIPMVIPSVLMDVPLPIDRIPLQQGKDLGYIKMLAERVGYVFYLEPGPVPGVSKAYWGPEIKVGAPQPALNVGHGCAHQRRVAELQLRLRAADAADHAHLPQGTQTPIPIPCRASRR
jgi:hypothetical protein